MNRFILNPRRSPRVPARCHVGVICRGSTWEAETEDVGPAGCQLVSPRAVSAGGQLRLAIAAKNVEGTLSVLGRVVWASSTAPIRLGVAFDPGQPGGADPSGWFERLLQAQPAMVGALRRVPERLTLDTVLFLGRPPRFLVDFTAEELAVLRQLGSTTSVREVLASQGPLVVNATSKPIFALLARRALTLSRAEAVPAWK